MRETSFIGGTNYKECPATVVYDQKRLTSYRLDALNLLGVLTLKSIAMHFFFMV